jgi:hypothetical protein
MELQYVLMQQGSMFPCSIHQISWRFSIPARTHPTHLDHEPALSDPDVTRLPISGYKATLPHVASPTVPMVLYTKYNQEQKTH